MHFPSIFHEHHLAAQPPSYFSVTCTNQVIATPTERPQSFASSHESIISSTSSESTITRQQQAESLCSISSNTDLDSPQTPACGDLPSYSSGADVQPITSENSFSGILKVTVENSKISYDIGDVIHGKLSFSPVKPIELSSISVSFEGEESTVKNAWNSEVHTKRKLSLGRHTVLPSSLPSDMKAIPGFIYSFPFSFRVPDVLPEEVCTDRVLDHIRLPPSLGSSPNFILPMNNLPDNVARIFYLLHATVEYKDSTQSDDIKKFHAFNFLHILPSFSLTPENIKRAQVSSSSGIQSLRKGLFKSSNGSVELQVKNLPAIPKHCSTIATVPLVVSFYPNKKSSKATPPQITQVSVKLISRTLFTTQTGFKTSPPNLDTPEATTVMQKHFLRQITPANTIWEEHEMPPTSTGNGNSQHVYKTVFNIPVSLHDSKLITPTFESCFIARDYTLDFTVRFEDKSIFCVSAPVNVVSTLSPRSNLPFDPSFVSQSQNVEIAENHAPSSKSSYSQS